MPSRKSAVGAIVIAFAVAAPGAYAQTQPPAGKPSSGRASWSFLYDCMKS